eukprot:1427187-Pleurochrysis_carterae.AAC.1
MERTREGPRKQRNCSGGGSPSFKWRRIVKKVGVSWGSRAQSATQQRCFLINCRQDGRKRNAQVRRFEDV